MTKEHTGAPRLGETHLYLNQEALVFSSTFLIFYPMGSTDVFCSKLRKELEERRVTVASFLKSDKKMRDE